MPGGIDDTEAREFQRAVRGFLGGGNQVEWEHRRQMAAVSVIPLWLLSGMVFGLEKSWHLVFEPLTAFEARERHSLKLKAARRT